MSNSTNLTATPVRFQCENHSMPPPEHLIGDFLEIGYLTLLVCIGTPLNLYVFFNLWQQLSNSRTSGIKRAFVLLKLHVNLTDLVLLDVYCVGRLGWLSTYEWLGGDVLCKLYQFLTFFSLYGSSNVVVCISIDRLRNVMAAQRVRTHAEGEVKRLLAVAWLFAVVWSLPQLFAWRARNVADRCWMIDTWVQCTPIWADLNDDGTLATGYNVTHLLLVFWLPLLVMAVCYTIIAVELVQYSLKPASNVNVVQGPDHTSKHNLLSQPPTPRASPGQFRRSLRKNTDDGEKSAKSSAFITITNENGIESKSMNQSYESINKSTADHSINKSHESISTPKHRSMLLIPDEQGDHPQKSLGFAVAAGCDTDSQPSHTSSIKKSVSYSPELTREPKTSVPNNFEHSHSNNPSPTGRRSPISSLKVSDHEKSSLLRSVSVYARSKFGGRSQTVLSLAEAGCKNTILEAKHANGATVLIRQPAWRRQLRSKVFRTTLLIVLTHVIIWLPYQVIAVSMYISEPFYRYLSDNANIFKSLQLLITLVNPFLYGLRDKDAKLSATASAARKSTNCTTQMRSTTNKYKSSTAVSYRE